MGNALSRVVVALVLVAMLMSTSHLTEARPGNQFHALDDVREEGLSRFNERDLFSSDNNYADDDFELSERTLEDNDEDDDQLNQSERTLEDDDDLDQSERSLEETDDELDQSERTINDDDDDDLEQSKRMFQDDDDAEERYQYERSIHVDGEDTISSQIFGENEKQKRKNKEHSGGSQGQKNASVTSKMLKDCSAQCLPKTKNHAERIKCTRECVFHKL
jgi:hypothetical protein